MPGLDEALELEGARMRERGGAPVAERFGSPIAEYRAIREGTAILDARRHARWLIAGPDRERALHGILSNEIRGLAPWEGRECLLLTARGTLVAALTVIEAQDAYLSLLPADCAAAAHAELSRYLARTKSRIGDAGLSELWLLGGSSPQRFASLFGAPAPQWPQATNLGSVAAIPFFIGAIPGFRLLVQPSEELELWKRVRDAGVPAAGELSLQAVRIEEGAPAFGYELGPDVFPQEVGLSDRLSATKGCYVGQEVMARIENLGHVNRILVRIELDAREPPSPGTRVFAAGAEIGALTSVASIPGKKPMALAIVRREAASAGASVGLGEARVPARILDA